METLDLKPAALAARGVSLRRQQGSDTAFLRALYATERASELAMTGWDDAGKAAFVDHQFGAKQAHFAANRPKADYLIVVRAEGGAEVPIGKLYLDRSDDPWELLELILLPEATGSGLGADLLGWAIATTREGGAPTLALHVAIDNPRAEAFYRKHGFVEVDSRFSSHRRFHRATTLN